MSKDKLQALSDSAHLARLVAPCNHKIKSHANNMDHSGGPCVWWCLNCGAINTGFGWQYPKRVIEARWRRRG